MRERAEAGLAGQAAPCRPRSRGRRRAAARPAGPTAGRPPAAAGPRGRARPAAASRTRSARPASGRPAAPRRPGTAGPAARTRRGRRRAPSRPRRRHRPPRTPAPSAPGAPPVVTRPRTTVARPGNGAAAPGCSPTANIRCPGAVSPGTPTPIGAGRTGAAPGSTSRSVTSPVRTPRAVDLAVPAGPVPVQSTEDGVEGLPRPPGAPPVQRQRRVLDEHAQRPGSRPPATASSGSTPTARRTIRSSYRGCGVEVRHGYGTELAVSPRTAVVTSGWSGSSGASIRAIRRQ